MAHTVVGRVAAAPTQTQERAVRSRVRAHRARPPRQLPFRIVMKPLAKGVSYHVAAAGTLDEIEEDWKYMEQNLYKLARSLDSAEEREDFLLVKITSLASTTSAGTFSSA